MAFPIDIRFPEGLSQSTEEALRGEPSRPVRIEIPESWCYRIRLPGPPNGWTNKQQDEIRSSLLPEPLDDLHWDEEIDEDGRWVIWALSKSRLEDALLPLAPDLFRVGRTIRVFPCGQLGHPRKMTAFPNLAPSPHRAKRLPWKRFRVLSAILIPMVLLGAGAWTVGGLILPRWNALQARRGQTDLSLSEGRSRLLRERLILQQLKGLEAGKGGQSPWIADLDALTRLLPEDSFLVKLRWDPEGIQIDLVTPNPELIRSILEAAPEFKNVAFQGDMERHGEKNRLTLSMQPEVPR